MFLLIIDFHHKWRSNLPMAADALAILACCSRRSEPSAAMTKPKYVNCWATSTVVAWSRVTGGLTMLEDGSTTIILLFSQLTCSPTFATYSCSMWSVSTSWSIDFTMSPRSSAKSTSERMWLPYSSPNPSLEVVFTMKWSRVTLSSLGASAQPCRTPLQIRKSGLCRLWTGMQLFVPWWSSLKSLH